MSAAHAVVNVVDRRGAIAGSYLMNAFSVFIVWSSV
jgi:hypothetical protein